MISWIRAARARLPASIALRSCAGASSSFWSALLVCRSSFPRFSLPVTMRGLLAVATSRVAIGKERAGPLVPAGTAARCRERSMAQNIYDRPDFRSEEHTSELQSLMRISYAVFCLKKKKNTQYHTTKNTYQARTETNINILLTYD